MKNFQWMKKAALYDMVKQKELELNTAAQIAKYPVQKVKRVHKTSTSSTVISEPASASTEVSLAPAPAPAAAPSPPLSKQESSSVSQPPDRFDELMFDAQAQRQYHLDKLFGTKLYPRSQTSEYGLLRVMYRDNPERFQISDCHPDIHGEPHYTVRITLTESYYLSYHLYCNRGDKRRVSFRNLTIFSKPEQRFVTIASWI